MLKTHRFLAASVLAAGVWVATPACASGYYRYDQRDSRDYQRRAYDIGYRDGLAHGEDDARHRRDFRVDRDSDFRHADDGYRRDYGDREFYRRAFRQGYEAGYREGFNRFARPNEYGRVVPPPVFYPNQPPAVVYPRGDQRFYSPGAQSGYRDGLEAGRRDARDGDRFDPARSKWYRDGDRDYDRRFGSREDYKRDYRAAFQRGYEEGYRSARVR